jgi:zinc/manganese transport system substrate-binding protein
MFALPPFSQTQCLAPRRPGRVYRPFGLTRRWFGICWTALFIFGVAHPAQAERKLNVVASFSVLADMVTRVAGSRADVLSLVPREIDPHSFRATPSTVKAMGRAELIVINGLGFDSWVNRLSNAAGQSKNLIVASSGVSGLAVHGASKEHGHTHSIDPHAWHSIDNAQAYVRNITRALCDTVAALCKEFESNAAAYHLELADLQRELSRAIAQNAAPSPVITIHASIRYLSADYGLEVIAAKPEHPDSDTSAHELASLLRRASRSSNASLFWENAGQRRLVEQLSRDSGVRLGGRLYTDTLSVPTGPASTYTDMLRHNIAIILGLKRSR